MSATLSKSLGHLKLWKRCPFGISGTTSFGNFRVIVFNDNIVRISASLQESFDDFSYAVTATPSEHETFEVQDTETHLTLVTQKIIVRISKAPVRFSFLKLTHEIINEDDEGFGISWNGEQVTTYKKMLTGERYIGLGEKTGALDKKGHGYQNWNTDSYGYSTGADPLYCSTPFYIGVHNGLVYGIFFDNSHKSFFNFGASNNRFISFSADAGDMNYYFIFGENLAEVIAQYTHLTGRIELPPLWSIGYQQCRYSYYPDKEVLSIAATFREKNIPADVMVLDIHHMDQYKIFTWNTVHFPNPKTLIEKLRDIGFHVVVICDPGIKIEQGYEAYEDGVRNNFFIKYPDDTNYTGQVWPGWCHFPDFTNPAARAWWEKHFNIYVKAGVDGFWNDMNEIATWGNMLPENIVFDFEGQKASTRKARNVYGFQMARSTYEGTKNLMKGKRAFNLTRAGFSGVQRYAAVWTGDNVAYDDHMILGVRMVNNMGLAGIAFAGYDVGGFVGDANTKLFARWITLGAFSPLFRGHSMINSRDSEPWSYGEEVEQIARNYISFRYQLLPYIYSVFYEASQNGLPVQRSLAIDYTHKAWVYDHQFQNQYLFGPSLLIAPADSHKDFVKVYLPEGDWYYVFNGKKHAGDTELVLACPIHKLPVFIKAGAIIPMQRAVQHTGNAPDELILHVYYGGNGNTFTYYEDDGQSYDYQSGKFLKRVIEYKPDGITLGTAEGNFRTTIKTIKLVLHGTHFNQVTVNGKPHALASDMNSFFPALEKFDPFYDPEPVQEELVETLVLDYSADAIEITWQPPSM